MKPKTITLELLPSDVKLLNDSLRILAMNIGNEVQQTAANAEQITGYVANAAGKLQQVARACSLLDSALAKYNAEEEPKKDEKCEKKSEQK